MKPLHDMPEASTTWFATYHPHYKEKLGTTKSTYNPSLLQSLLMLISLLNALFDCVVKVIASHYPHYKDKLFGNPTWSFVCTANSLHFLYNLGNLSAASLLACNGAYVAESGLVTKKEKPPRTSLHLISRPLQASSLLSLTLSEYTTMSKWQYSSALASFPLLADYSSIKLTSDKAIKTAKTITKYCKYLTSTQNLSKVSLDLSRIAQTVNFLPDNIVLLNRPLRWPITNKSRRLRYD